jgi:magnesium transporter
MRRPERANRAVTEPEAQATLEPQAEGHVAPLDELIRAAREALHEGAVSRAAELAKPLHVADQADLIEQLSRDERAALVGALKPDLDPELLTYLDESVRAEVLELLGPKEAGEAIAQLETDDAIVVLQDLDPDEQIALLATLPLPDRAAVEQGLAYPDESAGRLMQRELVAVPEFWTVGQTIDWLRANPGLPDDFYDIYIINPRFEPVGSIPLSKVLRSKRGVLLTELRLKELHLIPVDMDQEEVGFQFRQYGLVSAPVVNAAGRLLGVITVDDVVHVIEEEAEEDILKLGGVQETDIFARPLQTGLHRFPWLLINLGTAILASMVIALFEKAIQQVVALAVLMPIVASMGGNGGTQTVTIVVRALATREITPANSLRVLGKEFLVGGFNGFLFLVIGVLLAVTWFGDPLLGALFGAALLINLIFAGLAGVAIPIVFERFGVDPALASGVFLTTITDVVGFFSFLGLATLFFL